MVLRVEVESQGHRFQTSVRGRRALGGGDRRPVYEFTRKSRKNLLDKMASLEDGGRVLFWTLTYREIVPPSEMKVHLTRFTKRVVRRFPRVCICWRFGVESDGERDYNPHLHLLFFNLRWLPIEWLERVWSEVTEGKGGWVWVELVGWRRVLGYVSKYVARLEQRRSLDYMTKLTGETWVGRWWGFVNRRYLPLAELFRASFPVGRWYYRLRRCGRRVWSGVNSREHTGFTLYRENPDRWLALCVWLGASVA